ncbi:MAG: hypothetical protein IJS54_01270 [Desulfovibrio sp.]|nr:hypothetical protein [Desulfovibrio sp.]
MRTHLLDRLKTDANALEHGGESQTAKNLVRLWEELASAHWYHAPMNLAPSSNLLFYDHTKLTQYPLFITTGTPIAHAALITYEPTGLISYCFRCDAKGWMWPFLGLSFCLVPKKRMDIVPVLVHTSATSTTWQNAALRESIEELAVIGAAFALVWEGILPEKEAPLKVPKHKKEIKAPIHPSSFDKRGRTKRVKRGQSSGQRA